MSYRARHRRAAFNRRLDRIEQGLPEDPSNRTHKRAGHHHCPFCKTEVRQPSQFRLHLLLDGCQQVAS
jgi:hypothetical protein